MLVPLTDQGAAVLGSFQELRPRQLGELLTQLTDEEVASINQAIDLLVVAARRLVAEETP